MGLEILRVHCLPLPRNTEQSDGVPNELALDFFIQRTISREAGAMVDLKKVGLAFIVQHDIEAEDFEAHRVFEVVDLAGAHCLGYLRLASDQRLDDDVLNALHQLLRVLSLALLEILKGELQAALVTHRVNNGGPIRLKLVRVLVNRVIGQVHGHVF